MAFSDWFMPLVSGVTGLTGAGVQIGSAVAGNKLDKAALAEQQKQNEFNQQMALQNLAFQKDQFAYSKDLNAQQMDFAKNQYMYSARDAENAGINRLAMTGTNTAPSATIAGGSLNGANFSNQVFGTHISALASLGQSMNDTSRGVAQLYNQKQIAREGNKNAIELARMTDATNRLKLAFEKDKWKYESAKLKEEIESLHGLNEYEAAHGVPYQHRNAFADGIVAIAGLLNKTLDGKGEIADLGKTISDALKDAFDGVPSVSADLPTPVTSSGFDVEKLAERIAEDVSKKNSTGFKYRYSKAPSNKNRSRDANDDRYSGR